MKAPTFLGWPLLIMALIINSEYVSAQFTKGMVVSTRPLNLLIQNPSFEVEKLISSDFSLGFDAVIIGAKYSFSTETNIIRPAAGHKIGGALKYYFDAKDGIPQGWYLGLLWRYGRNKYQADDEYSNIFPYNKQERHVSENFEERLLIGGHQWIHRRITFGLTSGLGFLFLNRNMVDQNGGFISSGREDRLMGYFSFSLGVYLGKMNTAQ